VFLLMIMYGNIDDFNYIGIFVIYVERSKFKVNPKTIDAIFLWNKKFNIETWMEGVL